MRGIPGLFGQKHSNRDYSKAYCWGKNQFNSSFPASLVAYMHSKNVDMVYLTSDENYELRHGYISGKQLFNIDPLSDDTFYSFESSFLKFEKYYFINPEEPSKEHIDLVILDRSTNNSLSGLEVKLTALPDNTTKDCPEDEFGCEIVVRPPTLCYLVCGICEAYNTIEKKEILRNILNRVPKIYHWNEPNEVRPHFDAIKQAVIDIAKDASNSQIPLIIQPVWKMKDGHLAEDCLDVFVWSNLAVLQMCTMQTAAHQKSNEISRLERAVIWVYLMLRDFVERDQFDYKRIVKDNSYGNANDKAFSISGTKSHRLMACEELTHPRISKGEIKNIILGGGQNLLSPERRFDAVIVNSPDLFE